MTRDDRRRGMFLGLAIGDALGAAVEFQSPGTFPEVTGYRDGGPHGLGPGEWTDDTSMALALADSIGDVGWDLNDQAGRYLSWLNDGEYSVNGECFDVGMTTRAALVRFERARDARASGSGGDYSAGNGSIMRLAPVPIAHAHLFPDEVGLLMERAMDSSLPTHASRACLSACAYFAVVLAGLADGRPREEVLDPDWDVLARMESAVKFPLEIRDVIRGSFRRRQPPEIVGSGYVVRSLEAALWAFHDADDFRTAVLRAVNLGDDADTTGAVCGQLAGAYWGVQGIPGEWLDGLARRDLIDPILEKIIR